MPASDGEIAITKLVTVHPENAGRGLPTIQGEVVVMEAATGTRLGLLDGATVTARRTAALSLLAAKELAPHPEGPLLIVGAGTQARAHLEAFHEGLGVSRVFLVSRTRERATTLAERAATLGMEARVVDSPEQALDKAKLVVTATTSREPVLPEKVSADVFIAAVGAFEPEAAELPAGLVSGSSIVVDTLEGARQEAGDLIQAEEIGAPSRGNRRFRLGKSYPPRKSPFGTHATRRSDHLQRRRRCIVGPRGGPYRLRHEKQAGMTFCFPVREACEPKS